MSSKLSTRKYDLLRLIKQHGPIGSIRLCELMQLHGYSIKDRTIRLELSNLDEKGFTEKAPGQGRRLTQEGETELSYGDVNGRLDEIRTRIATLTSQVTYDPIEDSGALVVAEVTVAESNLKEAVNLVKQLEDFPFNPFPISIDELHEEESNEYRFTVPSSVTLDGVLLNHGINTDLTNAGIIEYEASTGGMTRVRYENFGGNCLRYVDVISGEGSSIDVISLLIEARRSDISSVVEDGKRGLLLCDHREFPINRFEEAQDLLIATRSSLGGAINTHRPRNSKQISDNNLPWSHGGITYAGPGEILLSAFNEYGIAKSHTTFYGTLSRNELSRISTWEQDDSLSELESL